eukprot:scaffold3360_cov112-Isochrysis_galbana.AAC.3
MGPKATARRSDSVSGRSRTTGATRWWAEQVERWWSIAVAAISFSWLAVAAGPGDDQYDCHHASHGYMNIT